jgi:hypothetical protein
MERDTKRSIPGQKDAKGAYLPPAPASNIPAFKIEDILFEKQLRFVRDPHSYKIAVCSRRAGKTVACAVDLIETAMNCPDSVCLYITLSRNNAKKIIWPELLRLIRKYQLIPDKQLKNAIDKTELSITFPHNNAVIYCSGAKDSTEIEKFRGLALKKVYIDESQSFRDYIRELIDDVLEPALLDHAGTLCLIGTPGAIPVGYFAEIAGAVQSEEAKRSSESWTHFSWTFFDNPHVVVKSGKTHQELLQRVMKRRGVTLDDPTIQREYFGRWKNDSESLWIKYLAEKCDYAAMPNPPKPEEWNYIMGIDLGFNDADAIAVLAWSSKTPATYLVEEKVVAKQGLTELVEQIHEVRTRYNISKMVIDEGGLGKKLAEEMRRRHHLPVQAADKARKQENVEFLNDALRTGRFRAKAESQFAQDCHLVEIDKDKSTPDRIRLSDRYHSDIIDAVLYAFKESPAFTYEEPVKKLIPGTKEWAEAQAQDMFNQAMDHFQNEADLIRRISGGSD